MQLIEIVQPDFNHTRSVNLERDYGAINLIDAYQVTDKTLEVLERFVSSLKGERINAWSLTGPYGMGKSAFVNYLLSLTGPSHNKATGKSFKKLKQAAPNLHRRFKLNLSKKIGADGFLQIPITAAFEPINETIWRGLQNAVADYADEYLPLNTPLNKNNETNQGAVDSRFLINTIQKLQQKTGQHLLIVIDEFGKNLDYMAHYHDKGDIYIMQQLAEMPSVYMWVCLHQAFDEYVSGLSSNQKKEWSKVQGRFEDISFVESHQQMLRLIAKTVKKEIPGEWQSNFNDYVETVHHFITHAPPALRELFDSETISNTYPLHPVSAVALIELCKKYAQNDRTLLSFLCSGDNKALPAFLAETEINQEQSLPVVGLDYLYDYFFNISVTGYINKAESQRWIEIHDIINRKGYLSDLEKAIMKTVGVLNLLSGAAGLRANHETVHSLMTMQGVDKNETTAVLADLTEKKTLLYREYADEYRLWEGTDFDLNEAIQKKKSSLFVGDLDRLLEQYLPLPPVVASRHSYAKGTVRRFEKRWLSADLLNEDIRPADGYDGLFLYCYGSDAEPPQIPKKCSDNRPLLIAYVSSQKKLLELALEVIALHAVLEDAAELEHDSVARKEIKYRIKVAEEKFTDYCERAYSPKLGTIKWFAEGAEISINNNKELSAKLSSLCDECYEKAPYIGNEMINYNKLSGAAARARRELVEAMGTFAAEEQLGLQGYGPEVALYRSLLLANKLHVRNENTGHWYFTLKHNESFLPIWEKTEELIVNNLDAGIAIDQIISTFQEPPFGLRQGPLPIFITVFLMAKADEMAIFQEGVYKPYLNTAELALMLKRPELFTVKKVVRSSIEKEIFDVYQSIISSSKIDPGVSYRNATMLTIVGPLIKTIENLPAYSKNTKQISREAQQVRLAIQNATDPMQLLFEEIPAALSIKPEPDNKVLLKEKLQSVLQEITSTYEDLLNIIADLLLKTFSSSDLADLYNRQRERAQALLKHCEDSDLKAVLQAMAREFSSPMDWVKGVAGIVTKKPVDSWTDDEFIPFSVKIKDYASRIDQLEALVLDSGAAVTEETRMITIMMPDGSYKREIVNINHGLQEEIEEQLQQLYALPEEQSKAIVMALAEKLFRGDK